MKSLTHFKLVLGSLLLFAGLGCQKGSDSSAPFTPRGARSTPTGTTTPNPGSFEENGQSYFYTQATGRIFSSSQYEAEFSAAIKGLLSATLDEASIGSISSTNGVSMKGYVELDSAGKLQSTKSLIQIEVKDSYTGQSTDGQVVPPITLSLPASEGFASGGQVQLMFRDSYGWVRLDGQYTDGGQFKGVLSYANTNGKEGENISFEIETCGFFRCM